MPPQPSMARCSEARPVRSPSTTSAPSRRRASARLSSRRTKARTLCPLASRNSVRLRPMPPTAPAAPVTRIGLSCLCFVVISLTLVDVQKTNWRRGVRWNGRQEEAHPAASLAWFALHPAAPGGRVRRGRISLGRRVKQGSTSVEHDCWQVFDLLHQYASIHRPPARSSGTVLL